MANGNGKKLKTSTIIGFGVVGIGAYLIWREMQKRAPVAPAFAPRPGLLPTDSMLPGTLPTAAAGVVQPQGPFPTVQPQPITTAITPDQPIPPTGPTTVPQPYPIAQQPVTPATRPPRPPMRPGPVSRAMTKEEYLDSIGNPAYRETVVGLPPPAGMFPPFKGKAGPKQKRCLQAGGVWTGPTGRKFCVVGSDSQVAQVDKRRR